MLSYREIIKSHWKKHLALYFMFMLISIFINFSTSIFIGSLRDLWFICKVHLMRCTFQLKHNYFKYYTRKIRPAHYLCFTVNVVQNNVLLQYFVFFSGAGNHRYFMGYLFFLLFMICWMIYGCISCKFSLFHIFLIA